MNYQVWVDLLGRTSAEIPVQEQLRKAGVAKPPVVPKDRTSISIPADGLMLEFQDVQLFDGMAGGAGTGVLTAVTLSASMPAAEWPAPQGIAADATKTTLRERFGTPLKESEYWDKWKMSDKVVLHAGYKLDHESLKSVSFCLPGS